MWCIERQWRYPKVWKSIQLARSHSLLILATLLFTQPILAGIEGTKHNLTNHQETDVGSNICVFCHTPHGKPQSAMIPQWLPSKDKPDSFSTYDSLGRTVLGQGENIGSVSVACMSCHDGTQAMETSVSSLSFDHPFGVPYRGHINLPQESEENPIAPYKRAKVAVLSGFREADQAVIDEVPIWWVDTGADGRQRSDLQLFSRLAADAPDNTSAIPYVECASCHDPHNSNTTFLRISNHGSKLCLTCHETK